MKTIISKSVTIAQLHSKMSELSFCVSLNPACGMLEILTVKISDNRPSWKQGLMASFGQPFCKNNPPLSYTSHINTGLTNRH